MTLKLIELRYADNNMMSSRIASVIYSHQRVIQTQLKLLLFYVFT